MLYSRQNYDKLKLINFGNLTFIDGYGVRYTITRIQDDTGGTTRSIQGQNSLDGDIHGGGVEGLEHNLGHLFSVGLGVKGSLCEQDRVFLRGHTELIVEGVMPDLLHVIPVGNDAVLNGVLQSEDTWKIRKDKETYQY